MAVDALDPGPDGDYPNVPRNPDGTIDTTRFSIGERIIRKDGKRILIDVTPGIPGGRLITDVVPPPS